MSNTFMIFSELLFIFGPYILIILFLVLSLFTSNFKFIFYIIPVCVWYSIFYLSSKKLNLEAKITYVSQEITIYPIFHFFLYTYTFIYIIIPMVINNITNISIIVFFLFCIIYTSFKRKEINANITHITVGTIIGSVTAMITVITYYYSSLSKFLYYNDFTSNKIACSRPTKTKFRCTDKKSDII